MTQLVPRGDPGPSGSSRARARGSSALLSLGGFTEGGNRVESYLLTRPIKVALDGVIAVISLLIAHILRFDGWPPPFEVGRMILFAPFLGLCRITVNLLVGAYRRVWRYTSLQDALRVAVAGGCVSLVLLALRIGLKGIQPLFYLPFGIVVIDYLVSTSGMIGLRLLRRLAYENALRLGTVATGNVQRTLLVGAGSAGIMAVREIAQRRELGLSVVGFVDDDPVKRGKVIYGVSVLGATEDIPALVERLDVSQVIITMASAPRRTIRKILDLCAAVGVTVQIIPGLYEILGGQVTVSKLHAVQIEDLLGRDSINVAKWLESSRPYYAGRRVLITGAGGSIGRELSRQLLTLAPTALILLDKDENSIFEAERELLSVIGKSGCRLVPVICDLRIEQRLEQVFREHRPEIIFNAAAHKHVPLMETNTSEAVLNNVLGTANLLHCTARFGVQRCVMISTDKAVNPTNIMGATKRVAELLFQSAAAQPGNQCSYSCVRFGNVLGSRGSVIPTFREQIRNGGPVTITDPEMVRYFMTIPEAAQLSIQAGALGQKGEIFLLDMGEPVKIIDLARDMIRLSGLSPGEDIEIVVTGPRPGEKTREELLIAEEGARATRFEKVFVAPRLEYEGDRLHAHFESLVRLAYSGDVAAIRSTLESMNIGYRPIASEPRDVSRVRTN